MATPNFSLTYLGYAGFLFEGPSFIMMIDPWMSGAVYNNAWYKWPPYDKTDKILHFINSNKKKWIYITSSCQDRYDNSFIVSINNNFNLIAPNLESFRQRASFKYLINHQELLHLHDNCTIKFYIDKEKQNSGCLIKTPEFTLLNCNLLDNIDEILKDIDKPITFLTSSFGGSWYPICHDYDKDTMHCKIESVKEARFKKIVAILDQIQPLNFIPIGPAAIVNSQFKKFSQHDNHFPFAEEFLRFYILNSKQKNIVFNELVAGKEIKLNTKHSWIKHNTLQLKKDKKKYYNNLKYNATSYINVENLIKEKLKFKLHKYHINIDLKLYFSCPGEFADIVVDFKNKKVFSSTNNTFEDNYYAIIANLYHYHLLKYINWHDWMQRMDYVIKRNPDTHNENLERFLISD